MTLTDGFLLMYCFYMVLYHLNRFGALIKVIELRHHRSVLEMIGCISVDVGTVVVCRHVKDHLCVRFD